jgi:hypothetical protein
MVNRMLQLLQQLARSGPMLALLKMPVWEPESRMFKARQQRAPVAIGPEVCLNVLCRGTKKGSNREAPHCYAHLVAEL